MGQLPQLGVYLGHETVRDGAGVREIAELAEQIGLDYLWCSEHVVIPTAYESRYPFTSDGVPRFAHDGAWGTALIMLGHAAAVTSRVRLATSIVPITCHHPLALAKDAATVDRLSGGRLELGLGAGWLAEEAELLGLPSDRRGARLVEAIELMRAAWSESPFSFEGEFWSVPGAHVRPDPAQGADLPIWIGGFGKGSLEALERFGVGMAMPRSLASKIPDVRAKIGPEKRIACGLRVLPGFDPGAVREQIEAMVADGATEVHLVSGEDPREVVDTLHQFAENVLA